MLESLVVNILNKFLSDFIENIDSDQLNISLFSGKVTLNNLQVRRGLLDNMPLPFKLSYGRVGSIIVDVPVTSLSSKPLKIDISDVFVILKQVQLTCRVKSLDDWKENVEIEAYQKSIVDGLDTAQKMELSQKLVKEKDPGYFAKLAAKVVDNVQINVRNVYVRLEDTLSYPDTPWAIGLQLAELSMTTSNSNWSPQFVVGDDLMRKSLKIKDLALFLNYGPEDKILFEKFGKFIDKKDPQLEFGRIECTLVPARPRFLMDNNFIISPFSIEARITLNKNVKNLKPQFEGFLVFGGLIDEPDKSKRRKFSAQIDQKQISVLLRLTEYIGLYNTFKEAVLSQFLARQLSGEERSAYEKLYLEYYLLLEHKKEDKAKKLREELKKTEIKYSFQKMYLSRQIALKRYDLEKKIKGQNQDIQKRLETAKKKIKSKSKDDKLIQVQILEMQLQSESEQMMVQERANFDSEMDTLLESEKGLSEVVMQNMPKDWVRFKFGLEFPQLRFTLKQTEEKRYFGVVLDKMKLGAEVGGLGWIDAEFSISNFNVVDLYTRSKAFPFLIESVFKDKNPERKMLWTQVRVRPIDEDSDIVLRIKNDARFYIIGNLVTLLAVKQMFAEAVAKDGYDFSYFTTAIAQKAKFYIANGREAVTNYLNSQSEEDRKFEPPMKIKLDVDMSPPILLLPVQIEDPDTSCLAIDFGKLKVLSTLVDIKGDVDYRNEVEIGNLYNCYTIGLEGFSIKLLDNMQIPYREIEDIKSVKKAHTLLSEFNFYFKFYDSIDKRNTKMPYNILHLDFTNLDLIVTDKLIDQVFNLYTDIMLKIRKAQTSKGPARLLKKAPESVEQIAKLKAINEVQNQKERNELQRIDDLRDKIDRNQSFAEYAEGEEKKVAKPKKRIERILQLVMVSISRVNLTIAETYSVEHQSEAQMKANLQGGLLLENEKESLRLLAQANISGLEVAVLMTSEQNIGVNLSIMRLFVRDIQSHMKQGTQIMKPVIPQPYDMILCSPQVERAIRSQGVDIDQAIQGSTMLQMRARILIESTLNALQQEEIYQDIQEMASTPQAKQKFQDMLKEHKCQLEARIILKTKEEQTAISFIIQRLRLVPIIPFFSQMYAFSKYLIPPTLPGGPQDPQDEETKESDKGFTDQLLPSHTLQGEEFQKRKEDFKAADILRVIAEDSLAQVQISYLNKKKLHDLIRKQSRIRKEVKESSMRLQGSIGQIEVWIPRDPKDEFSRVFSVSIQAGCSYKQTTTVQNYYDAHTNFFKNKISIKSEQIADACVYDLGIKMYNRHVRFQQNQLLDPLTSSPLQEGKIERLLNPSSLKVSFIDEFNFDKNLRKRYIDLKAEPLNIQVGFRELDFFYELMPHYGEFFQDMQTKETAEDKDQYVLNEMSQNQALEDETPQGKLANINEILGEEDSVMESKPYSADQIFKQSQTLYFVNFNLNKFEFAMHDDTGAFQCPLLKFKLSDVTASVVMSQMQALNIIQKTIQMLCEKNRNMDFKEPHLKVKAGLAMEAQYFNLQVAEFEPLIEPWVLELMITQAEQDAPLKISIFAPQIINLNVTFGFAMAINKFKERMVEGRQNWEDERKLEKIKQQEMEKGNSYAIQINEHKMLEKCKISKKTKQDKEEETKFIATNDLQMPVLIWESNQLIDQENSASDEVISQAPNVIKFEPKDKLVFSHRQFDWISKRNRKKLGISQALKEEVMTLALKLPFMKPVPRIPVELCGTYAFKLEVANRKAVPQSLIKQPLSLCVKTLPQGNTKYISLSSSISFSNNTCVTLKLYGFKIQAKKSGPPVKFLLNIDKSEAKEATMKPSQTFIVPLLWLVQELAIAVQVFYDGKERYDVLFHNVKHCFDSAKYEKRLTSQMIAYNLDGQSLEHNVYISCDVSAFKCLPSKDPTVPPQFLVTFNPPLCVQNLFAEVVQGIDVIVMAEGVLRIVGNVPQGETRFFYDIDPYSKYCNHTVYFSFAVNDGNKKSFLLQESEKDFVFQSQGIKLARLKTQKGQDTTKTKVKKDVCRFLLYKGKNFSYDNLEVQDSTFYNEFVLTTEMVPFNILQTYDENFYLRDKVFELTSASKLILFPECQVINRTAFQFRIEDPQDKIGSYLQPYTRTLFTSSHDSKIRIKTNGFKWSNKFSTAAIGVSGALQLSKRDPKKKEETKKKLQQPSDENIALTKKESDALEFGIKIAMALPPYSRTKIVTIVPRYIIANNLEFPIVVRQAGSNLYQEYYPEKQNQTLFLKQHDQSQVEIEIRAATEVEQANRLNQAKLKQAGIWSSPFCITDIQDFQISVAREQKPYGKHWSLPSKRNKFRQIVRVEVVSMDEATIFICLNRPKYPDFTINNLTNVELVYQQTETDETFVVPPQTQIPFVWTDVTELEKKLKLSIGSVSEEYDLQKVQIFSPLVTQDNKRYEVELKVKKHSRCLEVRSQIQKLLLMKQISSASLYVQNLINKKHFTKNEVKVKVALMGLGVSLVDNEPKELIYISLYRMALKVRIWRDDLEMGEEEQKEETAHTKQIGDKEEEQVNTQVDFSVQHMQIDDMLTDHFKVIFTPEKIIQRREDESKEEEDQVVPFIQVSVTKAEMNHGLTKVIKYPALQMAIQRMILEIDTQSVSQMAAFGTKLMSIFNQEKMLTNLEPKEQINEEEKEMVILAQDLCEELKTSPPEPPVSTTLNKNKLYFEFIHFGAISVMITLQIQQDAFELELNPTKGFGLTSVFYTIGTSLANISDANLTYHEMIITNTFSSMEKIFGILGKKYIRHSIMQMYRIIGSSDLIGNPIGLVDKLGSGVFEFFNEPRKGMLKGPAEFVGGMGKGVTALVTNVVSGSFNSVSKITGSLYGIAKNVTGSKGKRLRKPDHVFEGVFMGIKGGVSEIAEGITGIFTKPFSKAKKEGATGFIKGVGAGLLGAVASPFTAMFRVGHSVASGVQNTATYIKRGKMLKQGRFRHPRYFSSKNILLIYNDDLSEAREVLSTIKRGKYISSELKFFIDVERPHKKSTVEGLVIITESEVLLIQNLKDVVFALPIVNIAKIGVFNENNKFILYLWHDEKKKKSNQIEDVNFKAINKIYEVLTPHE